MVTAILVLILVGILLGGVVNWLADQLPLVGDHREDDADEAMESVDAKDEHAVYLASLRSPVCVHCGASRPAAAYSGLVALILGHARCSQCGRALSWRLVAVELVMALSCIYFWIQHGLAAETFVSILYAALFVLIIVIDIEHRLVLNSVMLPAFVFALLEIALTGRLRLRDALVGYAIGQIIVMGFYVLGAVYLWIVNTARHEPVTEVAFGFGDVTLATFCGLVVGFPGVFLMLVVMVLVGGLIALLYLLYRLVIRREYRAHLAIPYGPAIVVAAILMLWWGEQVEAVLLGGG